MPRVSVSRTWLGVEGSSGSWNQRLSRSLHTRQANGEDVDSTSRTLIIVGVSCGTIAAVILIGILVYLIIRQRRAESVSLSSRIRNGYTQTRNSSASTYDTTHKEGPDRIQSGYKYDPESAFGLPKRKKEDQRRLRLDTTTLAPPRQTSLMQSATSPPPFAQYHPGLLGQPIRPHAELRVGDTPVTKYVPPAPPSWASIWPTESGWTGPGGVASVRDEDFGGETDESDSEDGKSGADDERGSQYAHDVRPSEHTFGPFKLSPSVFRGTKRKDPDVESVNQPTPPSPRPQPVYSAPRLDDDETVELTRSTDNTDRLETSTTGNFTLAFGKMGRSGTARSGTTDRTASSRKTRATGGGHSRTPSSVPLTRSTTRVTRSSTTRTAQTDAGSPVSTVSGQIMSVLTGRFTTPFLRSMGMGGEYIAPGDQAPPGEDEGQGNVKRSRTASPGPIRRLPALPGLSPIPPPPVSSLPPPRHHATAPGEIRPLPVPISTSTSPSPRQCTVPSLPSPRRVPRAMSLGPGQVPSTVPVRSISESTATPSVLRPLPAPPVVNP